MRRTHEKGDVEKSYCKRKARQPSDDCSFLLYLDKYYINYWKFKSTRGCSSHCAYPLVYPPRDTQHAMAAKLTLLLWMAQVGRNV